MPSGKDNGKRTENIIKKIMSFTPEQKISIIESLMDCLIDDVIEAHGALERVTCEASAGWLTCNIKEIDPSKKLDIIKSIYNELVKAVAEVVKNVNLILCRTVNLGAVLLSPMKICRELKDAMSDISVEEGEEAYRACIEFLKKKGLLPRKERGEKRK